MLSFNQTPNISNLKSKQYSIFLVYPNLKVPSHHQHKTSVKYLILKFPTTAHVSKFAPTATLKSIFKPSITKIRETEKDDLLVVSPDVWKTHM